MIEDEYLSRWSAVIPVLREFERYLAADAPRLRIIHVNQATWSHEEYRRRRRDLGYGSWYGVYLIFNASDELRYVGLAMDQFDSRIWSHDEHVPRHSTDVIPFEYGWYFFAPALEFFLINRLQPPDNTSYRKYSIGQRLVSTDETGE